MKPQQNNSKRKENMSIEEHLFIGLANGYHTNFVLKVDYGSFQSKTIEMLIHVNVAEQLAKWNTEQNYSHNIMVEYNADKFCANAFASCKGIPHPIHNISFGTLWRLNTHKAHLRKRKQPRVRNPQGRIDIAIMREMPAHITTDSRSIFGVEVKPINPDMSELMFDVNRLQKAMEDSDPVSDNSIETGYCAFIIRLDSPNRTMSKTDYQKLLTKYMQKLDRCLTKQCVWRGSKYEIITEVIRKETSEDYIKHAPNTEEYPLEQTDVVDNTGAVLAALIKITRK